MGLKSVNMGRYKYADPAYWNQVLKKEKEGKRG